MPSGDSFRPVCGAADIHSKRYLMTWGSISTLSMTTLRIRMLGLQEQLLLCERAIALGLAQPGKGRIWRKSTLRLLDSLIAGGSMPLSEVHHGHPEIVRALVRCMEWSQLIKEFRFARSRKDSYLLAGILAEIAVRREEASLNRALRTPGVPSGLRLSSPMAKDRSPKSGYLRRVPGSFEGGGSR